MIAKISEVAKTKTTLLLTSTGNYKKNVSALLKLFVKEKKIPGVYVTVNKSCKDMMDDFGSAGISEEKVFVIDMITETTGGTAAKKPNCLYLHSPQSLTDLAIALDEAVNAIKGKEKFVIIDSISTLFVYNPPSTVVQFAHFITNKMRSWGVHGVLIGLTKEIDDKTKSLLSQFCDEVVKDE